MEIIKRHGSTSTSKYESAVLIMEALKRDKEQGKDILPAMKLLNEEMEKKTLPRPQPDGVRQFMFDELMKIENNELNKFSTGRKVWGDVLRRLIGKNLERYKEFNEFYDRVLLDKVDVSKQKKDVKVRLADRIKQLSRGGDALSGVVVVDEVEKDAKQQREIGLSVSDKDKFVAFHRDRLNKEGISQPLRQQMIERFGKGK